MMKSQLLLVKQVITCLIVLFYSAFSIQAQTTVSFNYTGSVQSWVVPPCVTSISVTMAGADGGGSAGGNGAVVTGTIAVTPGQTLNIYVGGSGNCPGAGWNGGGNGQNANSVANRSCGGGGATDIRIGGTALSNRVMVASGGGGTGGGTQDAAGGNGGCGSGQAGTSPFGQGGGAGTQTSGGNGGPPWIASGNAGSAGTLGNGGNGATDPCYNNSPGGGGGGGYYGGGGGGSDCYSSSPYGGGSGGGGSSLVPAGGGCTSGNNNGPGYVTITYTAGTASAAPTNTGPYCVGQTIQLNAGGTGTTYSWTGPNGFTSSTQNPTLPATSLASGVYTVSITSAGCTATGTTTVTVNPVPTVNAGADQTVCSGTSVTLSATGATTYSWNNGVIQGAAFTPAVGTVTYTVTGTSAGCTSTDQVVVTVNPNPVVSAGPDVSICGGASTTLTASGATTYSWSPGAQTTASITVSPAATTNYTVTGTSNGCTGTDAVTVTVLSSAPISAGPDVTICEGQSTTLTGTGGNIYSWAPGGQSTASITVSPITSTTYTLTGTDGNGCVGTDQVIVNVNTLPIVNAGTDLTICTGTSVTLTATGASTYSWDNGVTQGVAFTPAVGTVVYTVTGTTASGCVASDQVQVTVNSNPVVNAGVDQTICSGATVTLTASGASTYSWDNGVSQGVPFYPTATTTYTVTGTSASGCIGTDQVDVTVNAVPLVNAGADQTVCEGASVTLNAVGASSYSWNNGVTQNVSFIPSVGSVTYTVTGTSTAGCTSQDQVVVTVNANPTPLITGPSSYCVTDPPVLGTTQAYTTYTWSNGSTNSTATVTAADNPISVLVTNAAGCSATSPGFNVTENSPVSSSGSITICQGESALIHGNNETVAGTYSMTYPAANGCDSVSTITLNVNPLPNVSAGSDKVICEGESVVLSATGAVTYSWTNGVQQGVVFTPAVGTMTYTVTGTSAQGCVNTDQVDVTVNSLPTISAGMDVAVCSGGTVTLSGSGGVIYNWNNGISNGVGFIPVASGVYTVTGTDANGCVNTDQVQVIVNANPTINAGSDQTLCYGESVTLVASGAASYTWTNGVTQAVPFVPTAGTLTYTVTGTTAQGCTGQDQLILTVNESPVVSFTIDQTMACTPFYSLLTNTTPNTEDCLWQVTNDFMGANTNAESVYFNQGGCYDVTLTVTSGGCTGTFTAFDAICAEEPPVANIDAEPNTTTLMHPDVQFINGTTGAESYVWDFGDNSDESTEFEPFHTYPNEVESGYTVMMIASSSFGCVDTAYTYIEILEDLIYYVPNTFTPDGDIFNQTWRPLFTSGFDPFDYTVLVFDRWGEVIWESHDPAIGWDGTYGNNQNYSMCQSGTYTWRIEFKTRVNDEKHVISGHVNLLK